MKLTQSSTPAKRRTTSAAERLTLDLMTRLQTAQVAGRMRDARIEAGLTQEQIAEMLGVHKRVVENIENNRLVKGPYQYVNAWSEITAWPIRQLLHGDITQPDDDRLEEVERLAAETRREVEEVAATVDRIEELLRSRAAES